MQTLFKSKKFSMTSKKQTGKRYSKWHLIQQQGGTPWNYLIEKLPEPEEQLLFAACDWSMEWTANKSCNSTLLKRLQKQTKQILEIPSLQIQCSLLPHGGPSQTGKKEQEKHPQRLPSLVRCWRPVSQLIKVIQVRQKFFSESSPFNQ